MALYRKGGDRLVNGVTREKMGVVRAYLVSQATSRRTINDSYVSMSNLALVAFSPNHAP
jgi:hypothetical protein